MFKFRNFWELNPLEVNHTYSCKKNCYQSTVDIVFIHDFLWNMRDRYTNIFIPIHWSIEICFLIWSIRYEAFASEITLFKCNFNYLHFGNRSSNDTVVINTISTYGKPNTMIFTKNT